MNAATAMARAAALRRAGRGAAAPATSTLLGPTPRFGAGSGLKTVGLRGYRVLSPSSPAASAAAAALGSRASPWRHWVLTMVFAPQVLAGAYFSFVHQRGGLDVMDSLRARAEAGSVRDVLFLTPCHVIPLYSHMHWDVAMHFLWWR